MLKGMIKRFIDNLNKESEIDESRRRVIKGVAGFAALAAVGPSLVFGGKRISDVSVGDFEKMFSSGVVEGMTFYLDRTIKIEGVKNLTVRNCKFIALDGFKGDSLIYLDKSSGVMIESCYFENGRIPGSALLVGGYEVAKFNTV